MCSVQLSATYPNSSYCNKNKIILRSIIISQDVTNWYMQEPESIFFLCIIFVDATTTMYRIYTSCITIVVQQSVPPV